MLKRWFHGRAKPPSQADIDLSTFSLFDEGFIRDPFPYLNALRESGPAYRMHNGSWAISRYGDIHAALAHPKLVNSPSDYAVVHRRHRRTQVCADVANNILPFLDKPLHTQPRRAITQAFHQLLRDHPSEIDRLAKTRLDALVQQDQFDLLHDFATPLCTDVMGALLGFTADEILAAQLKNWSETFFYLFSIIPSEEARTNLNQELAAFREFADTLYANTISPLRASLDEAGLGGALSDVARDNTLLLIADGVNSGHGIANALRYSILRPELLTGLREGNYRALALADELLRFDSPTLFIARRATEDFAFNGVQIGKNSGVYLMLAAGNRDPEAYNKPNEITPLRKGAPPLTFGKGEHSCVGRQLVRQILAACLDALTAQTKPLQLVDAAPQWKMRAGHRWLEGLPVRA